MNRTRAYLNRFVKKKEQEIEDGYHSTNLKDIKPITTRLMEHSETIVINNSKRAMQREVRDSQIDHDNKLLLQKISSVMTKKGAYSPRKTYRIQKSLNEGHRRQQLDIIALENKRFLQRLQAKKPTLDIGKLDRDWKDNLGVIKRRSNQEFYLTSIKNNSILKQTSTAERFYKPPSQSSVLTRTAIIDGQKMRIRIQYESDCLKIIGDCMNKTDLKIIEIPIGEAEIFVDNDCNGQLTGLIDKLRYDADSETLYLISANLEEEDTHDNPEIERIRRINKERTPRDKQREELQRQDHSKKKNDKVKLPTITHSNEEEVKTIEAPAEVPIFTPSQHEKQPTHHSAQKQQSKKHTEEPKYAEERKHTEKKHTEEKHAQQKKHTEENKHVKEKKQTQEKVHSEKKHTEEKQSEAKHTSVKHSEPHLEESKKSHKIQSQEAEVQEEPIINNKSVEAKHQKQEEVEQIEPQDENYEEQNFEEPKKEDEEKNSAPHSKLAEPQQIIVAEEEIEDYAEQFDEHAESKGTADKS